jgi:hypothetical protein
VVAADVVGHHVAHHLDAAVVAGAHEVAEQFIGAEAAVNAVQVGDGVAVVGGLCLVVFPIRD